MENESLLIFVPIRFGLGDINPPPSGVVRISIDKENKRAREFVDIKEGTIGLLANKDTDTMRQVLQLATLQLLSQVT